MDARVIIVEPDPQLEPVILARFCLSVPPVRCVGGIAEASDAIGLQGGPLLVAVRNHGASAEAARIACAFDLHKAAPAIRLIVLSGRHPREGHRLAMYLQALDHCIARLSLRAECPPELPANADFPRDLYVPISRVGEVPSAHILLVRNRLTDRKEFLLHIRDEEPGAAAVWSAIYADPGMRGQAEMMRHEISRHCSFVSTPHLPYDLASRVRALEARDRELGRTAA